MVRHLDRCRAICYPKYMRIHTICKTHNRTAMVGPGTLLDELECVDCVAIEDAECLGTRRPCCSRMNIDCCGHEDEMPDVPPNVDATEWMVFEMRADDEVPF